ncbi:TIGR03086 family protein [Micromonospora coriariae]|uniref:TIGR03086 family protein n=1 Tax=Micromonospora coriariae TaxID=285665 RepID=A0A1C4VQW0_9ACTN|nr:TIGR03086 family metal-binding protein [Micromonospora coriariae]SCE86119.1 TIGR03086 family protein [Micromonospora coriariae]
MTFAQQLQDYSDACRWVGDLATATQSPQLDARTPCEDFDVRSLLGHLLGTAHRSLATARGVSTRGIPHVITDVVDDKLALTYADLAKTIREEWSGLTAADTVVAPWGPCTALEAAQGFTVETVTHGWDLAVATGQPSEAPKRIADRCLEYVAAVIPDRLRGVMYGAPVVGVENVSATEQLAHLLGHKRIGNG